MDLIRTIAGVLLAGAALGLWLYGKRSRTRIWAFPQRGKSRRVLEAADSLSLTPQHSLHAVRAGGELLILAAHATGVRVVRITRLPGEDSGKADRREEEVTA